MKMKNVSTKSFAVALAALLISSYSFAQQTPVEKKAIVSKKEAASKTGNEEMEKKPQKKMGIDAISSNDEAASPEIQEAVLPVDAESGITNKDAKRKESEKKQTEFNKMSDKEKEIWYQDHKMSDEERINMQEKRKEEERMTKEKGEMKVPAKDAGSLKKKVNTHGKILGKAGKRKIGKKLKSSAKAKAKTTKK